MTDAFEYPSVTELIQAFRQGRLTPEDATEAALARIKATEPTLNAFQTTRGSLIPDRRDRRSRRQGSRRRLGHTLGRRPPPGPHGWYPLVHQGYRRHEELAHIKRFENRR